MQNKERLKRVLMVAVPGIDAACLDANKALLPNLSGLLGGPIHVYCKSHHCFPGKSHHLGWQLQYAPGVTLRTCDIRTGGV